MGKAKQHHWLWKRRSDQLKMGQVVASCQGGKEYLDRTTDWRCQRRNALWIKNMCYVLIIVGAVLGSGSIRHF
jgi:hypothetical protein